MTSGFLQLESTLVIYSILVNNRLYTPPNEGINWPKLAQICQKSAKQRLV
jgi:hypothetical protein